MSLRSTSLPAAEIEAAKLQLGCGDEFKVPVTADFSHTVNIQLAIDTLKCNFILMDSDAPLIRPVDFDDPSVLTAAQVETYRCSSMFYRDYTRFLPYI